MDRNGNGKRRIYHLINYIKFMLGVILIVIGAIFLLKNLGIITGDVWEIIWPVLLIALGLSFFFRRWKWSGWGWHWHDISGRRKG